MPDGVVLSIFVLNEVFGVLIDGVVGQVHAHVLDVVPVSLDVRLRREPRETLSIQEYPQWIYTCYHDVDSQVELQVLHQVRLIQIVLYNTMLSQLNVRLRVHCQVDPSTLTGGFRLHDKCRPLLLP